MQRFLITSDNRITTIGNTAKTPEGGAAFDSEQELATATGDWPVSRLVEIWNGLPEVTAVRKFKDRATAVRRIWKQAQSLPPFVEPAPVEKASGNTEAAPSKKALIVALLDAEGGATLTQLVAATGWQKHSVRGFISGAVSKKMGLAVVSSKTEDGQRVYRIRR